MSDNLPTFPPSGFTRYKAIAQKPGQNPFSPKGIVDSTQTVDLPSDTPREQVETWAREAAAASGLTFIRVEVITP